MDIIINRGTPLVQEAITGDIKMERLENIQTDEIGLKRLLLYLGSGFTTRMEETLKEIRIN